MSSYVVVDLEMCNVPYGARRDAFRSARELIQIGAVLIDENYRIIDSFETYVAPRFGRIDSFIRNLTGISWSNTKNAPSTRAALEAFANWLPDDAYLVAWSANDKAQIKKEIRGKHLNIPRLNTFMDDSRWIDCQAIFASKLDTRKCFRLCEALLLAQIDYDEGAHDALVDARNTARLFEKVHREEPLTLSPYLIRSDMVDSYTFDPFRNACRARAC